MQHSALRGGPFLHHDLGPQSRGRMSTLERCIPPCKSPEKQTEDLSPGGVWASWFSCILHDPSLTEEERMAERQKDWVRSEDTQCWGCSVTDVGCVIVVV